MSRLTIRREESAQPPRRWVPHAVALGVGVLLLGAVLGIWRFATASRPLEVTTIAVLPPDLGGGGGTVLTASGYIVARRKAGVGPKVPGLLEWLGVEEGSRVEKGQVIGRLQSKDVVAALTAARSVLDEARANLLESEATLEQYRKEHERARRLVADGAISAAEYDVAEARARAQEARVGSQLAAIATAAARVRSAEIAVEDTNIRAPFNGTVLTKDAEEGETVAPAAAGRPSSRGSVVTMADLATLEVEVDVNESYIARLRQDLPARIVADSFPDRIYEGRIRQVIPTADRQKATVQVKVSIGDPGDMLRPDMGAKVTFLESHGAATAPGHSLPRVASRAVTTGADGVRRVWVVEKETAKSVRVEVAGEEGGMADIRSGLSGGETVVADPSPEISEGRKIRARS